MQKETDTRAQSPFSVAAHSAADKFDPATILELLTPLVLPLEKDTPHIHGQPVIFSPYIHDMLGRFRSFAEAKNGDFRNDVTDMQRVQYLLEISNTLSFIMTEQDEDLYRIRLQYPFLQSAYSLVERAIDYSSYKFNIDLFEFFDRQNTMISPPESMFSPKDTLNFLAAYMDFIKKEFANHLAGDNKKSAGGIKSHFTRAAKPWKKTDQLSQDQVMDGFKKMSAFCADAKAKLSTKNNNLQGALIFRMLEAAETYMNSFIGDENIALKQPSPAQTGGATIIPLDSRRKTAANTL